ncbi:unnamed protein product [Phytophthora lilii]|uniref:Unnamed protein product n=1 Tax=Phytophthora lilii TaxID=2077276 RepID=A0A9W6WUP7_9STRA|nr:unnamed protein product [Phytophthora lilii]
MSPAAYHRQPGFRRGRGTNVVASAPRARPGLSKISPERAFPAQFPPSSAPDESHTQTSKSTAGQQHGNEFSLKFGPKPANPARAPRPSPTLFCFPGIASTPWHDTAKFDWVQRLEANRETITGEFLALKAQRDTLAKAKGADPDASDYKVYGKEHQLHQGQWDWLAYVTQGRRQADFAVQCPKTVEILESIPGFMAGLPFAYAFFSILKPEVSCGAEIGASGD